MKQFILIITVLMLSLPVVAQQNDENNFTGGEQVNYTSSTRFEGAIEPNVSTLAHDFNNRGIQKALKEKNFEAAAEFFRQAVESDSRCFGCRYNYGVSLVITKKYDNAVRTFTDLISIAPGYSNAYAGLGEAYGKKGLFKESAASYEKAVNLETKDVILFTNLGNALYQAKNYKKALIYLDKAIALKPDFAVSHINRGAVMHALGRNKEAAKSLERAIALQPDAAEAHGNMGVVLSALGKEKEAQKYYIEAARLQPQSGFALYNLARSYFDLGNRAGAQQQLSLLENVSPALAEDLKKVFFGKFVINVSDVK